MRRAMVATPAFSGEVSAHYCQSLLQSTLECLIEDITLDVFILQHQSLLPIARDILLREAINRGVDDILWIDSDMAWDSKDLIRILKHKEDIVGIPCRKKIPNRVEFNFQLIPGMLKPNADGLLEVNHIGTGFLKMSSKAIKYLFDTSEKYKSQDNIELSHVFEIKLDASAKAVVSEDFTACRKLIGGSFRIYIDTTLSCGHVGGHIYTGECIDFLSHIDSHSEDTTNSKVVIGLTTTPVRIGKIMPTISSLLKQKRPANRIILSLADQIARTGDKFDKIPKELQQLVDDGKIEIHQTKDYGPATKFIGAMQVEQDPSAFIVWCDDDMEYGESMVESLLAACAAQPKTAVGMMAFNMANNNTVYEAVTRTGADAEILEGFGGVICRRKDLPPMNLWVSTTPQQFASMPDIQKAYFLGDDCVMSYALRKAGTRTLALQAPTYCRATGVVIRTINFGPDALSTNKYTKNNMASYALLKAGNIT